jgi:hypothetical protein
VHAIILERGRGLGFSFDEMQNGAIWLEDIHRYFEVDLYKAMKVFISAKTRRADFGQF